MLNGKRSHSPAPYRNGNGVKMNGAGNVNGPNQQFNPLLQVWNFLARCSNNDFQLTADLF